MGPRPRLGRAGEGLSSAILTGGPRPAGQAHGFPQQPEAVAQPDEWKALGTEDRIMDQNSVATDPSHLTVDGRQGQGLCQE